MAQFDIHCNPNRETKKAFPFERELGEKVDELVRCRNEIIAALDLLITGI